MGQGHQWPGTVVQKDDAVVSNIVVFQVWKILDCFKNIEKISNKVLR